MTGVGGTRAEKTPRSGQGGQDWRGPFSFTSLGRTPRPQGPTRCAQRGEGCDASSGDGGRRTGQIEVRGRRTEGLDSQRDSWTGHRTHDGMAHARLNPRRGSIADSSSACRQSPCTRTFGSVAPERTAREAGAGEYIAALIESKGECPCPVHCAPGDDAHAWRMNR
jgi:hypothetical protein